MRSQAGKPWGSTAVAGVSSGMGASVGRPTVLHWMYAAADRSSGGEASNRSVLGRMCMVIRSQQASSLVNFEGPLPSQRLIVLLIPRASHQGDRMLFALPLRRLEDVRSTS